MARALIVAGGWDIHAPLQGAERFRGWLEPEGFDVELATSLDALEADRLRDVQLIVVHWTMGELGDNEARALADAVERGAGLAGVHGGLCDAFREQTWYQLLTGGQFVEHALNEDESPLTYGVQIVDRDHPITAGLEDFEVTSAEQYYLHVDPANHVLATTRFDPAPWPSAANGPVDMPLAWTRRWGAGRIFYCSVGHVPAELEAEPIATLCRRGFAWAGGA
jgi:type 1 glutamine amidotransferase